MPYQSYQADKQSTRSSTHSKPTSKTNTYGKQQQQQQQNYPSTEAEMAEIREALYQKQERQDADYEKRFLEKHAGASPRRVTDLDNSQNHDSSNGKKEVYYNDGGTPLFRSIEVADWETAREILRNHPEQASLWVVSTGTAHTTFDWSRWKRLPLHEAARRQPPIDFMTNLIQVYPDAVEASTHFGELPLHLAVECGASPSVVNLLVTRHWRACQMTDQSGRTPLEIFQDAELLDPDEQTAVRNCLEACDLTWKELKQEHDDEVNNLKSHHVAGLEAVRQQHDDDLVAEQKQQDMLLERISSLQHQLESQSVTIQEQEELLQAYEKQEESMQEEILMLQDENDQLRQAQTEERGKVARLTEAVSDRDQELVVLADRIVDMQNVLSNLEHWHQVALTTKLNVAYRKFRGAFLELEQMSSAMSDHGSDLHKVLKELDVPTTEELTQATSSEDGGVSSSSSGEDNEAVARTAQVARNAL